jgi:aspartate aminotransferase
LPGERIGYIVVPDEVADFERVYGGIAGAARVLTHVNASSLFQRVVARCVDEPSNIAAYERNGNLLYNGLVEAGFTCQKPQGAFYLFPKALEDDARSGLENGARAVEVIIRENIDTAMNLFNGI